LRLDDFDEDDGIRVDHFIYSGGDNQVNVELILEIAKRRIDNGHFYPTSSPESPWYFDSPTEVWRFVSRYDINGLLEIKNSDEFMKLDFRLLQNYPNPFNSTTTIKYYLQVPSDVNLSIYNTKGQLVHTLSDGWHSAGGYKKILNGTSLPTGKYFLCLEAGNQNRIVRIILLQ